MSTPAIDALAMVRQIRDALHERLKDATPQEVIKFYDGESAKFRAERKARGSG